MLYISDKHDRIFHWSTITKTPKVISWSAYCDKKPGASRLQEKKRQSNTVDYLFINMYSLKKLYYV